MVLVLLVVDGGDHVSQGRGELGDVGEVEHFVGPVGVALRAEYAGDEVLRVAEVALHEGQNRNRGAVAAVGRGFAEELHACRIEGLRKPGLFSGRIPARTRARGRERHLAAEDRIARELSLDVGKCFFGINRGRNAHRALEACARAQHVARVLQGGQAACARDHKLRAPAAQHERGVGVGVLGVRARNPREFACDLLAQNLRAVLELRQALRRNFRVELRGRDLSRFGLLNALQKGAGDRKGLRRNARGRARVHAVGENVHIKRKEHCAAKTHRRPKPLVVAAGAVQDRDEGDLADAWGDFGEPVLEVNRLAFFSRFVEAYGARTGRTRLIKRHQRGHGRVEVVAVVARAAPVEAIALDHGLEGFAAIGPPLAFGLLVEVAVEKDRAGRLGACCGRDVEEKRGRAAGLAEHFEGALRKALGRPAGRIAAGFKQKPVFLPLRIKAHRLGGNLDELAERLKGFALPERRDGLLNGVGHGCRQNQKEINK